MSTSTIDAGGIDRLIARFRMLANPNPTAVLLRIGKLMDEDNRRGILAGRDGADQPLLPVEYRPVSAKTGQKVKRGKPLTVEQRLGQDRRTKRGRYSRIGSGPDRANNNLTAAEYRLLDGPPLAPRRQFSRVITNYAQSEPREIGPGVWEVVGGWVNVLDVKGRPFLMNHFEGLGQKVRDLRGIRPWGINEIRITVRKWMIGEIQRG